MLKLIHKFSSWKKEIALNNVIIPLLNDLIYFLILLSVFFINFIFTSIAIADYAPRIQDINTGYMIKLASNSPIALNPVKGTDGKNYYKVGNTIVINNTPSSVSVSGIVQCIGLTWGHASTNISWNNAYHRLFTYVPMAGTNIEGHMAYRINSNLVMTIDTQMLNWVNIRGSVCEQATPTLTAHASEFTVQFPISVTFYINDMVIDSQLPIPEMDLGGYVRSFTRSGTSPPQNSWALNDVTVPMRLAASQLNVTSSCKTVTSTGQVSTLNLKHGQLNTLNYDSLVTESVTYNCVFSKATKVRLRLDYITDNDPQKRLPMVSTQNSNNKIYSELTMTDEITGQKGKDFKIDINDLRTIKITSHLQGTNAIAGDYKGSAWLIATFD
ncbi:TPA: adhesin [Proteus mirabilis]